MRNNRLNILTEVLVELPKSEFERFKRTAPKFIQAYGDLEKMNFNIIEQLRSFGKAVDKDYISIGSALEKATKLSTEMDKNYKSEVKLFYNFFKDFFENKKAKEITKKILIKLENLNRQDAKVAPEQITNHYKKIHSYIEEVCIAR